MSTQSGTDLAQLEYEFATNPNSEAFIPLAEAYLKMGRFVEAMVVCKKGIKAHPELPTGRLIMARIYSDQAKHQKAIEELNSLLKLSPKNADAFELLGSIHLKLGRDNEGVEFFQQALQADPSNTVARDELSKRGIDLQAQQAQAAAAQSIQSSQQPAASNQPGLETLGQSNNQIPLSERPTEREMSPVAAQTGQQPAVALEQPEQPIVLVQKKPTAEPGKKRKRIADIYHEMEEQAQKKTRKKRGFKFTIGFAGLLLFCLIIYTIYTWQAGLRQKKINEHLEAGRSQFNRDTYKGYKQALAQYKEILKLDKTHPEALSRDAFIGAILVGEYGESSTLLQESQKYLALAEKEGQSSTMHDTAAALVTVYGGGSTATAITQLEKALKENPESPMLHTTLGLIYMKKGDLSSAKEHLLKGAQQAEKRALVGLGEYALRRSLYRSAAQFFSRGLQADNEHIRSLLGSAMVSLVRGTETIYTDHAAKLLDRFFKDLKDEASQSEKATARLLSLIVKSRDKKLRKAALNRIEDMLKNTSSNALFYYIAAKEFRRHKRLAKARNFIQKALRLDKTRPDYVLEEASINLALKDYEAARARALLVQRLDSESGQSMLLVGDAYLGEKDWKKARNYYEKCRKFDDVEAVSHLRLGDLFNFQPKRDRDQAQAEYELAINALSNQGERRLAAEAAVKLAKIYLEKKRLAEFIESVQKAKTIDPSFPPPYALLASNLNLSDSDGRKEAKELCGKYLELSSAGEHSRNEYSDTCRKIIRR